MRKPADHKYAGAGPCYHGRAAGGSRAHGTRQGASPCECLGNHESLEPTRMVPNVHPTAHSETDVIPHDRYVSLYHGSLTIDIRYVSWIPRHRYVSFTPHNRQSICDVSWIPHSRYVSWRPHSRYVSWILGNHRTS